MQQTSPVTTTQQARDRIHALFTGAWVLTVAADCLRRGAVPPDAGPVLASAGLAELGPDGWRPAPGFADLLGDDLSLPVHLQQMATAAAGLPPRPGDGTIEQVAGTAQVLVQHVLPLVPGMFERLTRPGARICAARLGAGGVAAAVAALLPGAVIIGLEPDDALRERARTTLGRRADVRAGDLRDLHPDDRFDAVVLPTVLVGPDVFAEAPAILRRVLAPGGWVLVLCAAPLDDALDRAVVRWRTVGQGGSPVDPADVVEELAAAGLSAVQRLQPPVPVPVACVVAQQPS